MWYEPAMPSSPTARQDLATFLRVLANFSPEIGSTAMRARTAIFDVLPEAFEVVWLQQKNTGYGTGPKKQTEHFAWISPASKHVTFGFNYGAELPDPTGLLEGTGLRFRHVKLRTMAEVERPAFQRLLKAAVGHRVPRPQPLEKAAPKKRTTPARKSRSK
jgi:hypothetical protein